MIVIVNIGGNVSEIRRTRKAFKMVSYNSKLAPVLNNATVQKRVAAFTLLFMMFQILSPFGSLIHKYGAEAAGDTWTALPDGSSNASGHTSVWTGSEMIVWGGRDDGTVHTEESSGSVDPGENRIYNPSTNQWVANINSIGGPARREGHSAFWTGSKMIVWGGIGTSTFNNTCLNTGGIYDRANNSWVSISTTNAPTARCSYSAVWTGTDMIVWGGTVAVGGASVTDIDKVYVYNLTSGLWTEKITTGYPSLRKYQQTFTAGDKLVVWGGVDSVGNAIHDGSIYDLSLGSWTAMASNMSIPEKGLSVSTNIAGSEVLYWNGLSNNIYTLNTTNATWTTQATTGTPPAGLYGSETIWTGLTGDNSSENRMLVWGGRTVEGDNTTEVNTGSIYDFTAHTWSSISSASSPSARSNPTIVWTGTSAIVYGGSFNGSPGLNTGGKYTPTISTYAVIFDSNGATAGTVPSSQDKLHDTTLALAANSGNLSRTGFNFNGWNTAINGGGTHYSVGGNYITNAATTLYAEWTPVPTYSVTYDSNTGTGTPPTDSSTYAQGATYTLMSGSGLTKTGNNFSGWSTATTGGTVVAAGATDTMGSSAVTYFAQWTPYGNTAEPAFDHSSGNIVVGSNVAITSATSGAAIYYTTSTGSGEPTPPTTSSTLYAGPITITGDIKISAIAIASGSNDSTVTTVSYTAKVATPSFSVSSGSTVAAHTQVTISSTSGATIYFTQDGLPPLVPGSSPTGRGVTYNSANTGLFIDNVGTTTVKAVAVKSGLVDSSEATSTYTVTVSQQTPAATPTFSPASGAVTSGSTVTISTATPGANIYYTTNGLMPSVHSSAYKVGAVSIVVGAAQTIKAFAGKYGMANSPTVSASYTVTAPATPQVTPDATTYTANGATVDLGTDLPTNIGSGVNFSILSNGSASQPAPTGKDYVGVFDITPSIPLTGTYLAIITLDYPEGSVYKVGDTVQYWNGTDWSSEGVTVTGNTATTITFTTSHFSEFAILTSADGTVVVATPTTLPVTGSDVANILLNMLLAGVLLTIMVLYTRKTRFSTILS